MGCQPYPCALDHCSRAAGVGEHVTAVSKHPGRPFRQNTSLHPVACVRAQAKVLCALVHHGSGQYRGQECTFSLAGSEIRRKYTTTSSNASGPGLAYLTKRCAAHTERPGCAGISRLDQVVALVQPTRGLVCIEGRTPVCKVHTGATGADPDPTYVGRVPLISDHQCAVHRCAIATAAGTGTGPVCGFAPTRYSSRAEQ